MSDNEELHFPDDLKYTKTHEWCRIEGDVATVGISEYATHNLTDIVYIEPPVDGTECEQFQELAPEGMVESVKASTPIYAPLSGAVFEINEELVDGPEALNEDAYANWIYRSKISKPEEIDGLMDIEAYRKWVKEETH